MRIMLLAPLPPPVTGQSVAADVLLSGLVLDGHSVHVVNLSKNTFRQGISSVQRVAQIVRLTWQVWRAGADFDLVYLTTAESVAGNLRDLLLLTVLGKLRTVTCLHLHGGAGMKELLANRKGWIGRLNLYFLERVAGVIVLGERLSTIFDGYVSPDKIKIVKNFAAEPLFLDIERIEIKWAKTSPLRVLFLSNLLPGKGQEELLEAIAELPQEVAARMQFDFAGGFESDADRDRVIATMAALPRVRYHGVVHGASKVNLLSQAHVFCLPTYYPYEGQPISILEAYASGCVVLTTDHSGIFDVFTPGRNGLEVRPRSAESIRNALIELSEKPRTCFDIAINNRKEAEHFYTSHAHLRAMYEALGIGTAN